MKITACSTALAIAVLLSGCVGYNRALLATKTNVGLDIESMPPTAEITIARRELAIQPIFRNTYDKSKNGYREQALPLLASFGLEGNFFNPSITGHFAGGDAAINLAKEGPPYKDGSELCLSELPDSRSPGQRFWHWITRKSKEEIDEANKYALENSRPFNFATDTSYGLKVAWSGTTGSAVPDTVKLGYNRKEFASPPIFIDKDVDSDCTAGEGKTANGNGMKFSVKIPSFLASINNASAFEMFSDTKVKHVQFFATGRAATEFSMRNSVRQAVFQNMAPDAAAIDAHPLNQELLEEIRNKMSGADKAQTTKSSMKLLKRSWCQKTSIRRTEKNSLAH